MGLLRVAIPLGVLFGVLLPGCTALPVVQDGVCGNGVLEEGEVCDGTPGCAAAPSPIACRAYTCGEALGCPAGAPICGEDGLCRRALGSYRLATSIPAGFDSLAIGDLDGVCPELEGGTSICQPELVGSRPAAGLAVVMYLGADLQPVQTVEVGTGSRAPLVLDLDVAGDPGAGIDDLLVLPDSGVASYHGRPDRLFLPDLLRTPTPVLLGAVDPGGATKALPVRASVGVDPTSGAASALGWLVQRADGKTEFSAEGQCVACGADALPVGIEQVAIADLYGFSGCDELVAAPLGGSSVAITVVCETGSGMPEVLAASLPAGAAIAGPPRAALQTIFFGQRGVMVPWSDAAGLHTSLVDVTFGFPVVSDGPPLEPGSELLGSADLDGNGILDLLTTEGVSLCSSTNASGGPPANEAEWSCQPVAFFDPTGNAKATRVVLGELDGGYGPDLVALRTDGRTIYLSNPAFAYNQKLLPSSAPIGDVSLGDLDGDGRDDVVAVTEAFPGSDASLVVYYGSYQGDPEPPVLVTRVAEGVRAVHALPVSADGFADVLVAKSGVATPPLAEQLPLVLGGAGRALSSPLVLPEGRVPIAAVPLHMADGSTRLVVAGTSSPGGGDLVLSAFDLTASGLQPVGSAFSVEGTSPGPAFQAKPFGLTTSELGGSLLVLPDEVALGDPTTYSTRSLLLAPPGDECVSPLSVDFACLGVVTADALALDGAVGDVDGDGRMDLLIVGLERDTGAPALSVFFGNPEGTQPLVQLLPVVVPLQTSGSRLALLDLDPSTSALEVLVNGSLGFEGKTAAVEVISFDSLRAPSSALWEGFEWGATDLATADLDHDGVMDLIATFGSAFGSGYTSLYLAETTLEPAP